MQWWCGLRPCANRNLIAAPAVVMLRLGMVYEARGDKQKAADCYRKVIAFIKGHPDDYEPGFEDVFVKLVDRLDPANLVP